MSSKTNKKTQAATSKGPAWQRPALLLLPAVLGFLLYALTTLDHGFVLDDGLVLEKHRHVQNGTNGISQIMRTNYASGYQNFNDGLYRPLSLVTFALEKQWFDLNPKTSHFIQALLYGLALVLLTLWLRKLFAPGSKWPLWIALLFALHPIHTEVVANLKSRDEIMAFLFFCGAAWLFTKWLSTPRKPVLLMGAALSYLFAAFSKESAVTFVAIFPLIAWYVSAKGQPLFSKQNVIGTAVMAVPALLFLAVRSSVLSELGEVDSGVANLLQNPLMESDSFIHRLATAAAIQGLYIQKLFLPFDLSHDYSYNAIPVVGLDSVKALFWMIINAGLIGLGIWGAMQKKWWAFGILFYYITVAVVANLIILIGAMAGERFLFSPTLGWCIAIVAGISLLPLKENLRPIVFAGVALIWSVLTLQRIPEWESNYTLFTADVDRVPNSARAHYNAGTAMNDEAALRPNEATALRSEAAQHMRTALEIWPEYQDAYNNLGIILLNAGNYEAAHQVYTDFIKAYPEYIKARYNMGSVCSQLKRYAESEMHYEAFVLANPNHNQALFMVAEVEGFQNKFDEAAAHLERLIALEPQNDRGYLKLAMTHAISNRPEQAEKILQQAIRLNPNNADSHFNLGLIYLNTGRSAQARAQFNTTLNIDPNYERARMALQQLGG